MLALAQPAEAKIVYTPAHKWIPINHPVHFDLNHDGLIDFTLSLRGSFKFAFGFYASPLAGNQVVSVISNNAHCAAALPKGNRVGPKRPWAAGREWMFFISSTTDGHKGSGCPWRFVTDEAYLGVGFQINGQTHYGWMRVGHVRPREGPKAEATGYAYETIPNKPIIAGKTKGPDVVTLDPGSLGALAAGASRLHSGK